MSAKDCFNCLRKVTEVRRATTVVRVETALAKAMSLLAPGKGEQFREALDHGIKLRLFYCKCGALYLGPNHAMCDACVKDRSDDDWMPGRANKKRGQ